VKGINAENIYAKSFAKSSRKAMSPALKNGFELQPNSRFKTTSKAMLNEKQNRRYCIISFL
jgi:hypothetical protein